MIAVLLALLGLAVALGEPAPAWPQWGGPQRNFTTHAPGLADSWPAGGPRRVWQRPLGDGFSALVSDGIAVYGLYRAGEEDVAVAMDAATGETLWEVRYAAPFRETCSQRLGPVPRAAPLIAGDRLITVSAGGLMHSIDRKTGSIQWSYELLAPASDAVRACGYSSSPVLYKNTVVTTAGGKGRGVVAIDLSSGKPVWQSTDFENGYSSPLLIDLDGRPEVIVFTYGDVAGLNPDDGTVEWTRPHPSDQGVNVTTPVWGPDDHLLFLTSAYNGGSRVLKLGRTARGVTVDEVWASRRVRVHFGNAVRVGGRIYASNGDFGAAPFAAVDVATGETVWRDRSVARSTLIAADGRLIILDEDGTLVLATPGETGLTIHGRASVLESEAWTVPTLCGTRLFVRDRKQVVALDLGSS